MITDEERAVIGIARAIIEALEKYRELETVLGELPPGITELMERESNALILQLERAVNALDRSQGAAETPAPKNGLDGIFGQWPGDETEAELLTALAEIEGKE